MEELRKNLRELTEGASVLLDDRLYTFDSYRTLVQAVAYAKVALADGNAEEETLQNAYMELCEAVDGLELRESEPAPKKEGAALKKALPYLLGGAALGGLFLGKKLFGKKKKSSKNREEQ